MRVGCLKYTVYQDKSHSLIEDEYYHDNRVV